MSKIAQHPRLKKQELRNVLSKELAIAQRIVSKTIFDYEKYKRVSSRSKKQIRNNISDKLYESEKCTIRRIIHSFWFEKQIPTLDKIYARINAHEELPNFNKPTLCSLLRNYMGFEFVKRTDTSAVVEKDDIILLRRNYLEAIMKYRCDGRPIYYMGETCINIGESAGKDCFSKDLSIRPTKPNGKDKWLVVVHIGNEDGFVQGGLFCFESKGNTKDYRVEMNGDIILEWLKNVMPYLKDYAVIVMDNAPYHSLKHEEVPTSATEKSVIIEWLRSKGEVIDRPMVIAQLMAIVQRIKPLCDTYVVDEFVKTYNKTVLRLPQYHREINPIDMAWSVVQNNVNMYNTTYKLNDGLQLLEEAIDKVNGKMWKHFISIVVEEEKKLWDMDFIIDKILEEEQCSVVTLTDETSNESCASDGM